MFVNGGIGSLDVLTASRHLTLWGQPPRLPALSGVKGSIERSSTSPPNISDVLHASFDPGNALVIECAPFPAIRDRIRIRADFIGPEPLQMPALPIKHTHVRAKKLICGAGKEVATERRDIDESMGRIVDRVDVG